MTHATQQDSETNIVRHSGRIIVGRLSSVLTHVMQLTFNDNMVKIYMNLQ